jgi:DNA repair exonuclease SbcCD ATPase subunit
MDFSDGLNCVIGGRGTGKTTVLEAIRYALDRMPNETADRKRHEALERLLQANLGAGSIRLELETADGVAESFGSVDVCWKDSRSRGTIAVNKDKQARLEAQGWRVGSAEDFLRQKPRLARKRSIPLGRRRRSRRRTPKG